MIPLQPRALEVKRLVRTINNLVKHSKSSVIWDTRSVGSALYGLQNMTAEEEEMRELLITLKDKVSMSESLDAQAIGNALFGLKSIKSNCIEATDLIEILSVKISQGPHELSSQQMSNALFGLQSFDSSAPQVRRLIELLHSKLIFSSPSMSALECGKSF